MKNKIVKVINEFNKRNILILGDIMVDKFVQGTVSRISPEAPVPVVEVKKETSLPGGAGNVANNIAALKAKVFLVGVIGNDSAGENLKQELDKNSIIVDGIFTDIYRPTSVKTRIIAQHQQVVRVDWETKDEISGSIREKMFDYVHKILPQIDAIILSDYGKGVVKPKILKEVISLANKNRIPVTVDPKIEHFLSYRKVTCITPNLQEAVSGMRIHKAQNEKEIHVLGKNILNRLGCQSVLITRGEKGMTLFEKGKKPFHIPTRAKEVYDVTGAGDTVISVLTLGLASKLSLRVSAEIANYAAGVVVGKLGTATVSPEELKQNIKESVI